MSLPAFCTDCGGLLGDINPVSRNMVCDSCSKVFKLSDINGNDTTVLKITREGGEGRKLAENDIAKLAGLPSTSSIFKDCPSCSYNVCSSIYDDSGKFYFVCNACESIIN